ncbi:MAG: hypothetical protein R2752_21755 [Vicinamibacterales bacterium]
MTRVLPLGIAALIALVPLRGSAQQTPTTPTFENQTVRIWKALHDKIFDMARDSQFPDDKLSFRPHPDSRTILDEFRHVTIGLEMSSASLRGEQFDYAARERADAGKPKTRASVVAEMEAAMKESYALVDQGPKPILIFWIDHQAEHYGKLVSDYRMVGIVPPISRKGQ